MYEDAYRSKEKETEIFWDMFLGCPENTTVPQHLPGHLWAKGKSAAQNHLAPCCGEREDNGGLEVLGREEVRALAKDRNK